MTPLLALSKINWRRVGQATFIVVIVALVAATAQQFFELRKARLAYENPRVITVTRTVKVQGATKIVTRTVEVPGRKEVVVEEVRGPVIETTGNETLSEPVLSVVRTDRWLVGGGPSWRFNETVEWNVLAGRSFSNRLDLQGEVSQNGRVGARIVFRF